MSLITESESGNDVPGDEYNSGKETFLNSNDSQIDTRVSYIFDIVFSLVCLITQGTSEMMTRGN